MLCLPENMAPYRFSSVFFFSAAFVRISSFPHFRLLSLRKSGKDSSSRHRLIFLDLTQIRIVALHWSLFFLQVPIPMPRCWNLRKTKIWDQRFHPFLSVKVKVQSPSKWSTRASKKASGSFFKTVIWPQVGWQLWKRFAMIWIRKQLIRISACGSRPTQVRIFPFQYYKTASKWQMKLQLEWRRTWSGLIFRIQFPTRNGSLAASKTCTSKSFFSDFVSSMVSCKNAVNLGQSVGISRMSLMKPTFVFPSDSCRFSWINMISFRWTQLTTWLVNATMEEELLTTKIEDVWWLCCHVSTEEIR